MSLLDESYNEFEKSGSRWGMGIAKHMMGKCHLIFTELIAKTPSSKNIEKFIDKSESTTTK